MSLLKTLAVLCAAALPCSSFAAPLVLDLGHRLDEVQAERLEPLLEGFNKQAKDVQIRMVRRADGDAQQPVSLLTREEYARAIQSKGRYRPLHEVMREARMPLDAARLSPELRDGLVDARGQLTALPVAFATPVLYFNKAAFRAAGLDPEVPPKTWAEAQATAGKLVAAGSHCAYTTSWPAWVMIDNTSAWNGAEVSDAKGNLNFNGLLQIKHVAMMATWYKSRYFSYFGRHDEADRRFASGECGMLTSASSLSAVLADNSQVDFGVAPLPYHDDVRGAPQTTLADGAALWVAGGLKPAEYKAIARFVNYVMGPEVQVGLTLAGGYLPMTGVARSAAGSSLMRSDMQGVRTAYTQLKGKAGASPLRVSQIDAVRRVVEEELEAVWANRKPAKEALDLAVQRGNAALRTLAGKSK